MNGDLKQDCTAAVSFDGEILPDYAIELESVVTGGGAAPPDTPAGTTGADGTYTTPLKWQPPAGTNAQPDPSTITVTVYDDLIDAE